MSSPGSSLCRSLCLWHKSWEARQWPGARLVRGAHGTHTPCPTTHPRGKWEWMNERKRGLGRNEENQQGFTWQPSQHLGNHPLKRNVAPCWPHCVRDRRLRVPGPCWALAGAGRTLELEGEGQLVAGEAGGRPGATPLSLGIRAPRDQSHEDGLGWGCAETGQVHSRPPSAWTTFERGVSLLNLQKWAAAEGRTNISHGCNVQTVSKRVAASMLH